MTKKTKVLATSIASIAMCASIAVGGTFALFTSESEVNIAVTSGKVKMNALVDAQSVALTSLGEAMTGNTWANGGTASVEAGEVTLTNVTPGDKITFDIDITNESTVNVQYRTVVSCVEGLDLFSGLVVTLEYTNDTEDSQTFDGLTAYGAWNALAPDVEDVDTVKVTIELPNRSNGLAFGTDNLDNQYQGLSTKLNYRVEAVQGNAGVQDAVADENTTLAYTANDMELIARKVNGGTSFAGKTVKLMNDITLDTATTFALNSEVESNWTPIGKSGAPFQGTFDGQGYTIKNLVLNEAGKSNIGLFGFTTEGAIKNLTIENATVVGRLNVGVVAGTPYTSTYSNITVKGDVYVEGMSYVGGVGGKNAYANWENITVDVNEGSYVSANSVEDGTAYRTYVGGVIGFMGEGGHVVSNVTSNIDVIGTTCDVGGIVGIAHYGNTFKNCYSSGDVTITNAEVAADAEEIGGIAGVWHNGGAAVTFEDCVFEGTLTANITDGVDLSDNTIVGSAYSAEGTGALEIYSFYIQDGVKYIKNGVTGEVGLYLVPAEYEGDTVNVPEGVDYIGKYAFYYNRNVKTIKLSSSVKYLAERAFRNTSAETIILNEGLEVIPYQTFRDALNLKSIEIPSTVTTIAKEAFQLSGITELMLPATVKNFEDGALRDMKELITLTIEGDVNIPNYFCRASEKLETVYINGMNVTFASGTLFSNFETGDGSTITVYVKNEEIKARLYAADYAAKNYDRDKDGVFGYTIVCKQTADENGVYGEGETAYAYASDDASLNKVIVGGAKTVYLSASELKLPSNLNSNVTLVGTTATTLEVARGSSVAGTTVTFKGITIQGVVEGDWYTHQMVGAEKVVYENCVIIGSLTLYSNTEFVNCTFINDVDGRYSVYCYGKCNYSFENCKFEGTAGRSIKVYKEGSADTQSVTVYVTNCEFASTNNKKAGVEIDSTYCTYIVYVSGCTLTGATEKVWNAEAGEDANVTVYEEGVKVFPNA